MIDPVIAAIVLKALSPYIEEMVKEILGEALKSANVERVNRDEALMHARVFTQRRVSELAGMVITGSVSVDDLRDQAEEIDPGPSI